jgi:hypothetical protein
MMKSDVAMLIRSSQVQDEPLGVQLLGQQAGSVDRADDHRDGHRETCDHVVVEDLSQRVEKTARRRSS